MGDRPELSPNYLPQGVVQISEAEAARARAVIKKQCTDKRAYSTKKIAKEAIKRALSNSVILYAYQCSICAKYHLTSKKQ